MIHNLSVRMRCLVSLALVISLGCLLYGVAKAAEVSDVSIARAQGQWAEACLKVNGPVNCKVRELPAGVHNYRQVALDVWPANIAENIKVQDRIVVQDGLVAQFRVKQLPNNVVRIIGDVVYWPAYEVIRDGNYVGLRLDCIKERGTK